MMLEDILQKYEPLSDDEKKNLLIYIWGRRITHKKCARHQHVYVSNETMSLLSMREQWVKEWMKNHNKTANEEKSESK